jgi:maleate isomerase
MRWVGAKKFAVLIPSTNTSVQPEFDDMRPVGVTNHISRIRIPNIRRSPTPTSTS